MHGALQQGHRRSQCKSALCAGKLQLRQFIAFAPADPAQGSEGNKHHKL